MPKCGQCLRDATQFFLDDGLGMLVARCKAHPITLHAEQYREITTEQAQKWYEEHPAFEVRVNPRERQY